MKKWSPAALAIVAALSLAPSMAMAEPFFGTKTDFATGAYPYSVAIGDLNADGKPDLATANFGAGTVSVLLGNGDGTFGAKTDFTTGSGPRSLAIGDLNADGKPDLVLANLFSSTISVLLGNGDGSFGAKTDFVTGSRPSFVAIGDLNTDGKPDLVVTNSNGATVSVFLGTGNGSFGPRTDFATPSQPYSVAIGDLNADGKADLAVAGGGGVSVLLGTGGGAFGSPASYPAGSLPLSVAIGDVNGDGKPDLSVASYASNSASVLLGNGSGTFGAGSNLPTGPAPIAVATGLLDADAYRDLAVASSSGNTVTVLPGAGAGAFGARGEFATGTGPFSVAIGDLNGDGRPDLATANYGDNSVSILLWQLGPTSVSLGSTPNPSFLGSTVTLTAVVTPARATGSVTFRSGPDSIGTAPLVAGVATMTVSSLALGDHSLTARYTGDGSFSASTSPVVVQTVLPVGATTTALTANPAPSQVGQPVLLTAAVSPAAASGSVQFRDGASVLGTALLTGGQATLTVPGFALGSHPLTTAYGGDTGHFASTSPALDLSVNPAATRVTLVSSLNPSRLTQDVSFTATVTDSIAPSWPVTGDVEFVIDSLAVEPAVALSGGSAALSGISTLGTGPHTVQVIFLGTPSFLGSKSATLTQSVEVPNPVVVSVRDVPNDQGGHVNLSWTASYLDPLPPFSIAEYWILRSSPAALAANAIRSGIRFASADGDSIGPRAGEFLALQRQGVTYYWEFLSSLPASQLASYVVDAATTCDSVAGSNPRTAFMIMARTAGGAQWWFSQPDSGYSVDNLAPGAPASFAGSYDAGTANLHWGAGSETDIAQYRLYRGTSADFVPSPVNLVVAQSDTGYVDAAGTLDYYKLCAVDSHGNSSGFTALLPSSPADVAGTAAPAFALESVRPNPSRGGRLDVAFSLPTAAPARIELLDVSGRRVMEREVGALGAGRHVLALSRYRAIPPGWYLLRLVQGGDARVTRVTVVN